MGFDPLGGDLVARERHPRGQRVLAGTGETEVTRLLVGQGRGRGRILIRLLDTGRRVRLEVIDNGAGVDPGDEPKLFQPFFTTKPVGKGTGLGLSQVHGFAAQSGGAVTVASPKSSRNA